MIAAIVVTYNPDKLLLENIKSLTLQVDKILIIDNNSKNLRLIECAKKKFNVAVVYFKKNKGLSFAYNYAIKFLIRKGYSRFVISDQDSVFSEDYVAKLNSIYERKGMCLVGGNIYNSDRCEYKKFEFLRGLFFYKKIIKKSIERCSLIISSGTFITKEVISINGYFVNDMFIDYIDTEYCLRAQKNKIPVYVSKEAEIKHSFGYPTEHKIFRMCFYPKNYSLFRRFYIYRNRVALIKKYPRFDVILWDITSMFYDIFLVIFFEKNKISKIFKSIQGLRSGIFYKIIFPLNTLKNHN